MAHIKRTESGWRVQIERQGVRKSQTFPNKATATAWAAQEEAAILAGKWGQFPARTVSDAFTRYEREVSANKRGSREEGLRFEAIRRDFPELCAKILSAVKTPDLVEWRDARLKVVTKGTVQRDINLLRNVWSVASREWHWCGESPWTALKMPGDNPARSQRIPWQDIRRLVRWLGYRTGKRPTTKYQEVAWAFLIALRTAMRAGEIMGLTRQAIDLEAGVVRLGAHKTLETSGTRYVPLTRHGKRLLGLLCASEPLWTIRAASLDTLFRKARDACLLGDIHFHDSRAEALTLLSRKMDVMTLARISGHRDLRTLMSSYYRESASQIAARL
jgi:integrase